MSSQRSGPTPLHALGALLCSPLYALYGLVTLVRAMLGAGRAVRGLGSALSSSIRCANGHRNEAVGRWHCNACGATYHGWVGRCELCGAGAGWVECERCGVGIRLPWVRR